MGGFGPPFTGKARFRMAYSKTILIKGISKSGQGGRKYRVVQVTGDGSYSAGGYAVQASDFQLSGIVAIDVGHLAAEGSGGACLGGTWDKTNSKVKYWKGAGSAAFTEAAAGDPNGLKGILTVYGY